MSHPRLTRTALALLALNQAAVGALALVVPRRFFDQFPLGRGWVASLPPYNEHLVRDVGGLSLGFAVLFAILVVDPRPPLVRPVLLSWLVSASAHLAFHLDHVQGLSGFDAVTQSAGLALVVLLPAALLWTTRAGEADQHAPATVTSARRS